MQQYDITPQLIKEVFRKALRTKTYWRLPPGERAILYLSSKLKRIRSKILKQILLKIISKVAPAVARRIIAFKIGLKIAYQRVKQALEWGYTKALEWIKDKTYILYLGWTHITNPPWHIEINLQEILEY